MVAGSLSPQQISDLLATSGYWQSAQPDELAPLVYDELRQLAHRYMRGERPDHTLQTTALVNEAYLRLAGPDEPALAGPHPLFRRGRADDAAHPGRLRPRTAKGETRGWRE